MLMPSTQPAMINDVHRICGSWRKMMMPTDANAEKAARKVPTALKNSAASIFAFEVRRLSVVGVKRQLRRVDAQIKSDSAAQHHQQQKSFCRQRREAGADMGGHKQSARRACHRKAQPFENVGEFSDAGSHGDGHAGCQNIW